MNVFEAVKEAVTTRSAAEAYGINVNRSGMACCIFHEDKSPSMKIDNRYHCFGCGADGDVIDFTSQIFGMGKKQAAEKLAVDFGICYDRQSRSPPKPVKRQISQEQQFRQATDFAYRVLCDYLHLLESWKEKYAPKMEDENWHPLFFEALERSTYVEYLLDTLLTGSIEEKATLVATQGKEVAELEQRIGKLFSSDETTALRGNECTEFGNDSRTD